MIVRTSDTSYGLLDSLRVLEFKKKAN